MPWINPKNILTLFRHKLEEHRDGPGSVKTRYTFEGYDDKPMTPRAGQQFVKKSAQSEGIEEDVTLVTLRNGFAIHLLRSGMKAEVVRRKPGLEADQPCS